MKQTTQILNQYLQRQGLPELVEPCDKPEKPTTIEGVFAQYLEKNYGVKPTNASN